MFKSGWRVNRMESMTQNKTILKQKFKLKDLLIRFSRVGALLLLCFGIILVESEFSENYQYCQCHPTSISANHHCFWNDFCYADGRY